MTDVAWIGEHGPEWLSLPDGAVVIPLPPRSEREAPEDKP